MRKIDAMVAEKVMGWAFNSSDWYVYKTPEGDDIDDDWSPSTDPAAMMMVVEKMRELGLAIGMETDSNGWWVCVTLDKDPPISLHARSLTLPLAVCHAALRACAVPESDIAKALEER
jgi:hypothetical protein